MTVVYPSSVINTRLQDVVNAIDGNGTGSMQILDSGNNVLSTLALSLPSGTVSAGVLTFNNLPLVDPAAAASGFATGAKIEDAFGNVVISGLTVGQGGTDIFLTNGLGTTFIAAGQTVAVTAATITGH
jgi:hypothetical protein